MNTDPRGPHGHDETEGMFPHLHHEENVDEQGRHWPEGDPHGHHVHVTPLWPMVGTFAALILLTVLTVVTAKGLYFGNAVNLVIALIIAGTKAILVAAFFMHLLYDKAINTVIVIATMFAVVLFISLTVVDLGTRDMADPIEAGEIVEGGGASIARPDDQFLPNISPEYSPWHSESPSSSVLTQAREAYKAAKGHEGGGAEYGAADDAQGEVVGPDVERTAAEGDIDVIEAGGGERPDDVGAETGADGANDAATGDDDPDSTAGEFGDGEPGG